ncbi:hypothetical protein BRDID11002_78670 [Bradyrhizobium diazoefficiens]
MERRKLVSNTRSPSVAVVAEIAPRWITASSLRPFSQSGSSAGGDDIHKLALGEIAPLAVGAEEITDGDVAAAGVVQRSHDIRPDKTGSGGHQQHSNYPARCLQPDPCRSASFAKV